MQVRKVFGRMLNFAALFAGTLAYLVTIAGVMLFALTWEGCNKLVSAVRSLRFRRPT